MGYLRPKGPIGRIDEFIKEIEIAYMTPEELGNSIVDDFLEKIDKIHKKRRLKWKKLKWL